MEILTDLQSVAFPHRGTQDLLAAATEVDGTEGISAAGVEPEMSGANQLLQRPRL